MTHPEIERRIDALRLARESFTAPEDVSALDAIEARLEEDVRRYSAVINGDGGATTKLMFLGPDVLRFAAARAVKVPEVGERIDFTGEDGVCLRQVVQSVVCRFDWGGRVAYVSLRPPPDATD